MFRVEVDGRLPTGADQLTHHVTSHMRKSLPQGVVSALAGIALHVITQGTWEVQASLLPAAVMCGLYVLVWWLVAATLADLGAQTGPRTTVVGRLHSCADARSHTCQRHRPMLAMASQMHGRPS
eukprot:1213750-Amphidinium_carterae.1